MQSRAPLPNAVCARLGRGKHTQHDRPSQPDSRDSEPARTRHGLAGREPASRGPPVLLTSSDEGRQGQRPARWERRGGPGWGCCSRPRQAVHAARRARQEREPRTSCQDGRRDSCAAVSLLPGKCDVQGGTSRRNDIYGVFAHMSTQEVAPGDEDATHCLAVAELHLRHFDKALAVLEVRSSSNHAFRRLIANCCAAALLSARWAHFETQASPAVASNCSLERAYCLYRMQRHSVRASTRTSYRSRV